MIRLTLVVAVAENGVIGAEGALPWRIADDLRWFKTVTMGKPVVMGRKTYQSIGKPLPGRRNIVVTRSKSFAPAGVDIAHSFEAALGMARAAAEDLGADEIAVIGGAEIYAEALPLADRIYLTRVEAAPAGDAHFPALDPSEWRATEQGTADVQWSAANRRNQYACRFLQLDRVSPPQMDKGQ